ncbi:MAG: class I SAM-dependent methyltransferase [Caldilineaceae bacterium]
MNVKLLFDHAAKDYDRTRRQYIACFDDFYGTALDLIPYPGDAVFRVLDLGAGTGLLSALLLTAFPNAQLTLADISTGMLDKARQRFADRSDITYQTVDFIEQPLTGRYDLVVSALALHHTQPERLKSVFAKVYDVLEPGGLFMNADQALGTTPENEQKYADNWLRTALSKGCTQTEIEVAFERMKADKTAKLADQLTWMSEVGFQQVDCWYKNYRFVVYSGAK